MFFSFTPLEAEKKEEKDRKQRVMPGLSEHIQQVFGHESPSRQRYFFILENETMAAEACKTAGG